MSRRNLPFRESLERDIHQAIHPGGQHVGTPKVRMDAHHAQRLLLVIDSQEREAADACGELFHLFPTEARDAVLTSPEFANWALKYVHLLTSKFKP